MSTTLSARQQDAVAQLQAICHARLGYILDSDMLIARSLSGRSLQHETSHFASENGWVGPCARR